MNDTAVRCFFIPAELDAWLNETTDRRGGDELVARGLYLLRELTAGIPSPASQALLDDALARLELTEEGGGDPLRPRPPEQRRRRYIRVKDVARHVNDPGVLNLFAVMDNLAAMFADMPGVWLSKNQALKHQQKLGRGGNGTLTAVAMEALAAEGMLDWAVGFRKSRVFRLAEKETA